MLVGHYGVSCNGFGYCELVIDGKIGECFESFWCGPLGQS